jgi:nucleotide-binding universal stress UspA family protein
MTAFSRILCPIDFSDVSRRALDYATVFARWYGAALRVVHVALPMPPVSRDARGEDGLVQEERRALEVDLDALVEPVRAAGVSVEISIVDGLVVSSILSDAAAWRADLVVIGTHGHSGFDRRVLGSVTEKLLRKAACPVLTVPTAMQAPVRADVRFRAILCPVDFSATTAPVMRAALSLAGESGGTLVLLHVLEWPEPADFPDAYRAQLDEARAGEAGRLEARLAALVPDSAKDWCEVDTMVVSGKPAAEILSTAAARDADLIVLGSHAAGSTLGRLTLGSTADGVIRRAACLVLTVPPDRAEAAG